MECRSLLLLLLLLTYIFDQYEALFFTSAKNNDTSTRIYLHNDVKIIKPASLTNIFIEYDTKKDDYTAVYNDDILIQIEFGSCKPSNQHIKSGNQRTLDYLRMDDTYMLLLGKVRVPRAPAITTTTTTTRRYVWMIPFDIPYETGCLYVVRHDTTIIAQSRLYKISKEQQRLFHDRLGHGFYFDAVQYFYQSRRKNRKKITMTSSNMIGQMIYTVDDDNYRSNKKKSTYIIDNYVCFLYVFLFFFVVFIVIYISGKRMKLIIIHAFIIFLFFV